ncbi:O-methyltransferase-domain-containing protein [Clohesyomyces aquaticus]|uniref:O-methyltransferase-domain-containing protein n=1 Tax=Clohesyomyces aquaticus TaxID=1231657 RepID=A0A1Y1ZVE7_9PLEO|nr:O-methyltransferase-domain-containing protein [Clohesyomyces aquaticus]
MANRIAELAAAIADNTAKVNGYLTSRNLPALSFDADVPVEVQQDRDFSVPRDIAIEAGEELLALLGGSPRAVFTKKITDLVNLQAICRFDIASNFPTERDTVTYAELAKCTKLAEPDIRRVVRGAITNHIFKEEKPGQVSHTAASRFVAENPLVRQWIEMTGRETMPASLKMVDAMEKWPGSGEPNESGYNLANDTTDSCWEYMPKFPNRSQTFADAMSVFTAGSAYGPEALISYFSTNQIFHGTVVDIGGSHGSVSIPIIQKYPGLNCIIQDLPSVVDVAKNNVPPDVRSRVQYMAHDFFSSQPVEDADVYLFRWILHDWADQYASKILRALIPALKKGARILIHEYVVPEPGKGSVNSQLSFRWMDVLIRGLCNGKERDEQDWYDLLSGVDVRFKVRAIHQSPLSQLGIVDVEWCPE